MSIKFDNFIFSEPEPLPLPLRTGLGQASPYAGLYAILCLDGRGKPKPFRVLYFGESRIVPLTRMLHSTLGLLQRGLIRQVITKTLVPVGSCYRGRDLSVITNTCSAISFSTESLHRMLEPEEEESLAEEVVPLAEV